MRLSYNGRIRRSRRFHHCRLAKAIVLALKAAIALPLASGVANAACNTTTAGGATTIDCPTATTTNNFSSGANNVTMNVASGATLSSTFGGGGASVRLTGNGITLNENDSPTKITPNSVRGTVNLGGGNDTFNSPLNFLGGITGLIDGQSGTNTFAITGTGGDGILPTASLANFQILNMTGTGNLVVPSGGTATFSSGTNVTGGNLVVNGTLNSPTTVGSTSALIGSGSISGPVTVNGTLAPAGLVGGTGAAAYSGTPGTTLTTGSLVLGSGSTTQIGATAAGVSDQVQVNGTATLGGQLIAMPTPGSYGQSTTYTILGTTGGVSGNYASVVQNVLPFLHASVTTNGNNVQLTLAQAPTGPGGTTLAFNQFPGETGNQQSMATALQTISTQTPARMTTLLDAVRGLAYNQVLPAFDSLTGESYASATQNELMGQMRVMETMFNRMQAARVGSHGKTLWVEPYAIDARQDAVQGVSATDYRNRGVIFGGDVAVTPSLRLGASASAATSRTKAGVRTDTVDTKQYSVGAYAMFAPEGSGWWVDGTASYGWQRANSDRLVHVGSGLMQRAGARYNGTAVNAGVESGYRFNAGQWHIEPFAGAYYTKVKYDAFREMGSADANLNVGSSSASNTQYGVGLRLSGDLGSNGAGGSRLHPMLMARYLRGNANGGTTTTMAFSGAPEVGFTTSSAPAARNRWQGGAGLSYDITPQANAYVYVATDRAAHTTSNSANVGFRWDFDSASAAAVRPAPIVPAATSSTMMDDTRNAAPVAATPVTTTPALQDPATKDTHFGKCKVPKASAGTATTKKPVARTPSSSLERQGQVRRCCSEASCEVADAAEGACECTEAGAGGRVVRWVKHGPSLRVTGDFGRFIARQ